MTWQDPALAVVSVGLLLTQIPNLHSKTKVLLHSSLPAAFLITALGFVYTTLGFPIATACVFIEAGIEWFVAVFRRA